MEFPDVKIGRAAEWLVDKAQTDLEYLFVVIGLFLISGSIYMLKNAVTKGSVRVERFDRTAEENTDALIEAAREIKLQRRAIEENTQMVAGAAQELKIQRQALEEKKLQQKIRDQLNAGDS